MFLAFTYYTPGAIYNIGYGMSEIIKSQLSAM